MAQEAQVKEITGQSVEDARRDAFTRLDELAVRHESTVKAITQLTEELEAIGLSFAMLGITEKMLLGK